MTDLPKLKADAEKAMPYCMTPQGVTDFRVEHGYWPWDALQTYQSALESEAERLRLRVGVLEGALSDIVEQLEYDIDSAKWVLRVAKQALTPKDGETKQPAGMTEEQIVCRIKELFMETNIPWKLANALERDFIDLCHKFKGDAA